MAESTEQRNPIEILAEEFIERQRRGESPTVAEYADTHPDLADKIRELFPTIVAMERLKNRKFRSGDRRVELHVDKLQQLGDYRIVREIGRGGMGIIYEAEQQSLGRRVAVKVFAQQALADSKHLQRFKRESRTAAGLHHTNIVPVFGVGEQDGLHYYVMQFIHGISLDKIVARLRDAQSEDSTTRSAGTAKVAGNSRGHTATDVARSLLSGESAVQNPAPSDAPPDASSVDRTTPARHASEGTADSRSEINRSDPPVTRNYWHSVARIALQAADALSYAHAQGTFHRDIKPSNLLLDAQGTVWVTDFGLAKAVTQENLSQTGDIVGTLRYMPPEQLRGEGDGRSDICSLGLTLYELLTLRPAYDDADPRRLVRRITQSEPTPPRKLRPEIPRDLETIVLKAITHDPDHRYQSAGVLADDLRSFLADRPIRARRVGPAERLWRWSRRNPAIASLSGVLLVVVFAAFGAISWKWSEAESEKHRAQAENQRAEANLSLALDSMNQFLVRFASTWMAHPNEPSGEGEEPGVEFRMVVSDSSASILQDALNFYDQFAEQNAGNPRLRLDTAMAYRRVGEIHQRLGHYEKAESAYQRAVEIYAEQTRGVSSDATLVRDMAATLNDLGLASQAVGRYHNARPCFERARQILSNQLVHPRDSPDCRYELARTHNNLAGVLWRMRRRDRATEDHRRALELLEELVEQHPDNPSYRHAQAHTYRSYFPFGAFRASPADASRYRSQAVELLEGLVRDFPDVPDYQCELSEMLVMAGGRFGNIENPVEAEPQLRRAIDLAQQLQNQYPAIPRYRTAFANASQRLGTLLRETDRPVAAEQYHREAVELHQALADEFPNIRAYRFYLDMSYRSHAETLRGLGSWPELRDLLQKLIARREAYYESSSHASPGQGMLVRHYESLAETLRRLGEDEQAEQASQKAEQLRAERKSKRSEFRKRSRRRRDTEG